MENKGRVSEAWIEDNKYHYDKKNFILDPWTLDLTCKTCKLTIQCEDACEKRHNCEDKSL